MAKKKPSKQKRGSLKKSNVRREIKKLKPNHNWKAPPGYKIFVADAGLVSFNFPADWLLKKTAPIEIHDGDPPDDNARITVTIQRTPPGVDWSGLPLKGLLEQSVAEVQVDEIASTPVEPVPRDDLEIVWTQRHWRDPENDNREAYTRMALVRGIGAHVVVAFDYWVDDADRMTPVWDELIRSLQMDRKIADPTQGDLTN